MAVSQVIFNGSDLINLTGDTVTPDKVLSGYTFHGADGNQYTGTAEGGGGSSSIIVNNGVESKSIKIYPNYLFNDPLYDKETFDNSVEIGEDVDENLSNMFRDCHILNSNIKISDKATNTSGMFNNCYAFNQNVQIPGNVTDTSWMFSGCNNYNFSPIIPENATNISGMFNNCYAFNQNVQISNNVVDASFLFSGSEVYNFNTVIPDSVINTSGMFNNCHDFNQNVQIPGNVTDTSWMFSGSYLYNFNVIIPENVTNMSGMFNNCSNFHQVIQLPDNIKDVTWLYSGTKFNTNFQIPDSVTNTSGMFNNCHDFNQNVQIPANVTDTSWMFSGCDNYNFNVIIPQNVTNTSGMFNNCKYYNISNIILQNNVSDISWMFSGCEMYNVQQYYIPCYITNVQGMFYNCTNLNNLPLRNMNGYSFFIKDASYMLANCTNFNLQTWGDSFISQIAANIENSSHMFDSIKVGKWYNSFNNLIDASYMYNNIKTNQWTSSNGYYDRIYLDKMENMAYMFANCNFPITSLTTMTFNTSLTPKVKNISHIFNNTNFSCNGFSISTFFDLIDMSYAFYNDFAFSASYLGNRINIPINVKNSSYAYAYNNKPTSSSAVDVYINSKATLIEDGSYMFANRNSSFYFESQMNVINASHMFDGCYQVSRPLLQYVVDGSYAFNNVKPKNTNGYFGGSVYITGSYLLNGSHMYNNVLLSNFNNTNLYITAYNLQNASNMFKGNAKASSIYTNNIKIVINNNFEKLENVSYMFSNTNIWFLYNNDTSISNISPFFKSDNIRNFEGMFCESYACNKYLHTLDRLYIPQGTTSIAKIFDNCNVRILNDIYIPNTVTNVYGAFRNDWHLGYQNIITKIVFNSGSDEIVNMDHMFDSAGPIWYGCPVYLNVNKASCYYTFSNCYLFNAPVVMPNYCENTVGMFYNCKNFNQQIDMPNGVKDASWMFELCDNLSANIIIPNTIKNISRMFLQCNLGNINIYMKNININNIYNFDMIFYGRQKALSSRGFIKVYCEDPADFITKNLFDTNRPGLFSLVTGDTYDYYYSSIAKINVYNVHDFDI